MDGYKDLHNHYRVDTEENGTWNKVYQTFRMLKDAGVRTNVLCVVTGQCAKHPGKVYRELKKIGAEYIQFIPCLDPLLLGRNGVARSGCEYCRRHPRYGSGHEVFAAEDGTLILCAGYDFDRLGAFLYEDLFQGLRDHYLPKRCNNCVKRFLLDAGIYSDYCELPLANDETKTCRMVSARKKYDTKCKEDPIWNIYNKAYIPLPETKTKASCLGFLFFGKSG